MHQRNLFQLVARMCECRVVFSGTIFFETIAVLRASKTHQVEKETHSTATAVDVPFDATPPAVVFYNWVANPKQER